MNTLITLWLVSLLGTTILFSMDTEEAVYHFPPTDKVFTIKVPASNDSLVVDGYFSKFAFGQGEMATLYINAKIKKDTLTLGIYDINGRLVTTLKSAAFPQKIKSLVPHYSGFGYAPSSRYVIPKNLKSGMYFVANKIPFIVKNTSLRRGDFLVVHPSHNDLAYNNNGGYSFYYPSHSTRTRIVSFERPWIFGKNGDPRPFYKWLNTHGYNADYICDDEMQDYPNIEQYKLLIIAGHSEYWTRNARLNFDKFVDTGKNALILSGNTMYWQTRFDPNKKQLTCYKYDASYNDPIKDPLLKTTRWEDKIVKYDQRNSIGLNFFSYGGYTTMRANDTTGFEGFKIVKPNFAIFKGMNLHLNDVVKHNSIEYDGSKVKISNNPVVGLVPEYDNTQTQFYKVDILGWDFAIPDYGVKKKRYHAGLFLILKRKQTSGIIVNMGSSNWCNEILEKPQLQQITANSIEFLLKNKDYSTEILQ